MQELNRMKTANTEQASSISAQELRGMPVVKQMAQELQEKIEALAKKKIEVTLAVVRVGEREDDLSYERGLLKRFDAVSASVRKVVLPLTVTQEELEQQINQLNEDTSVHGILVFRPLPKHLNEKKIKEMVSPDKDVDCMGSMNSAHVFAQDGEGHAPCTPQAVMEMLHHYEMELQGKKAVVVGRSMVVGKPLAMMLLKENATVTICHTKTENLKKECQEADYLFAAAGAAEMIDESYVRAGQVVIDVGINMKEEKLCGDVKYDAVKDIVAAISPVPGGVGTVTTSVLLKHTVLNAERMAGTE